MESGAEAAGRTVLVRSAAPALNFLTGPPDIGRSGWLSRIMFGVAIHSTSFRQGAKNFVVIGCVPLRSGRLRGSFDAHGREHFEPRLIHHVVFRQHANVGEMACERLTDRPPRASGHKQNWPPSALNRDAGRSADIGDEPCSWLCRPLPFRPKGDKPAASEPDRGEPAMWISRPTADDSCQSASHDLGELPRFGRFGGVIRHDLQQFGERPDRRTVPKEALKGSLNASDREDARNNLLDKRRLSGAKRLDEPVHRFSRKESIGMPPDGGLEAASDGSGGVTDDAAAKPYRLGSGLTHPGSAAAGQRIDRRLALGHAFAERRDHKATCRG